MSMPFLRDADGFYAWALVIDGDDASIERTTRRTREQARKLKREMDAQDLFKKVRVVKISITLKVVDYE